MRYAHTRGAPGIEGVHGAIIPSHEREDGIRIGGDLKEVFQWEERYDKNLNIIPNPEGGPLSVLPIYVPVGEQALPIRAPELAQSYRRRLTDWSQNAPVYENDNGARIPLGEPTSGYGMRTNPYDSSKQEWHPGVDRSTRPLTEDNSGILSVPVVADGIVVAVNRGFSATSGYGGYVVVDHGYGVQTMYAHNSAINVNPGDVVTRGQVIATSGESGRATGPHVHFEVRVNTHRGTILTGNTVNPEDFDWRTYKEKYKYR